MFGNIKAEMHQPVLVKGYPQEKDFKLQDRLAEQSLQKLQELGDIRKKCDSNI